MRRLSYKQLPSQLNVVSAWLELGKPDTRTSKRSSTLGIHDWNFDLQFFLKHSQ